MITYDTLTLIQDELESLKIPADDKEWLQQALGDPDVVVFNAPRPLFGAERKIVDAPVGFFVAVIGVNDDFASERAIENARLKATILKLISVAAAQQLALDSVSKNYRERYKSQPAIWADAWRTIFDTHCRKGVVTLTEVEAKAGAVFYLLARL